MTITRIIIKDLNKYYSYDIDLHEEERLLILTGTNGYGKTTILNIIKALSDNDLFFFYTLQFSYIRFGFSSNDVLEISSSYNEAVDDSFDEAENSDDKIVYFSYKKKDKIIYEYTLSKNKILKAIRRIGFYNGGKYTRFYNLYSKSFRKFITDNPRIYNIIANEDVKAQQMLMFLNSIKSELIPVQRITDSSDGDKEISSITDIAENLRSVLEKEYYYYLTNSEEIDEHFIDDLLSNDNKYTEKEYFEKAEKLKPVVDTLKSFGMLNNNIDIKKFDEEKSLILTSYIDSVEKRISVYLKILDKMKLFSEIIAQKNFSHKSINFSLNNGFYVVLDDGTRIDENYLSSGEKNEIIMLYRLIFSTSDNSILLIDEPENSLHIVWQQMFIDDIYKIAELKKLQVIVATHSPEIIAGNWNLCFDLTENNLYSREDKK